MKTRSIMLQTLCVPCACRCRYCLLSWDGKTIGADYDRCERYARQFWEWIGSNRPDLAFHFSFGFSMDHPRLLQAVDFQNSIGSVSGRFLQFGGMSFRTDRELSFLFGELREHGVEALNFTFYGTEDYHDRFAGRKGDFAFTRKEMQLARAAGLHISVGIPVTRENAEQTELLICTLEESGAEDVRLFVPHEEGRGARLNPVRFSLREFQRLGAEAKRRFNTELYKTEAEWCASGGGKQEENRALILSLTADNMERFGQMGFAEAIRLLEDLDEAYYAAFPAKEELVRICGDREGEQFYSRRDLLHHYRTMYAKANGLDVYDVTDERQCGSRRY